MFQRSVQVAIALMCLCALPSTALAERGWAFSAHVQRILIMDGRFANCMVRLSVSPQAALPNCGPDWVSFACDGSFDRPKDIAYKMLEHAQIAHLLNKRIDVEFDDTMRLDPEDGSYCIATRVDLK